MVSTAVQLSFPSNKLEREACGSRYGEREQLGGIVSGGSGSGGGCVGCGGCNVYNFFCSVVYSKTDSTKMDTQAQMDKETGRNNGAKVSKSNSKYYCVIRFFISC